MSVQMETNFLVHAFLRPVVDSPAVDEAVPRFANDAEENKSILRWSQDKDSYISFSSQFVIFGRDQSMQPFGFRSVLSQHAIVLKGSDTWRWQSRWNDRVLTFNNRCSSSAISWDLGWRENRSRELVNRYQRTDQERVHWVATRHSWQNWELILSEEDKGMDWNRCFSSRLLHLQMCRWEHLRWLVMAQAVVYER